jgi:hypothetical protein
MERLAVGQFNHERLAHRQLRLDHNLAAVIGKIGDERPRFATVAEAYRRRLLASPRR